eukprot:NODE_1740_length_1071_cov_318.468504.p2 GENE.NODE_1740_length_1071_cov_318.468504~~NODE_1740_length_1071_cov_318.468504.p2  ORF type:complete len:264 (+),score=74.02 NODE_1740_length_1071_cov_318.468504:29-793(+)
MLGERESQKFETTFRIGDTATEEFYFTRDGDPKQAIYPLRPCATVANVCGMRAAASCCGPDEFAGNRRWLVRGTPGESVHASMAVEDGQVTVRVKLPSGGEGVWRSAQGSEAHAYYVSASSAASPVKMKRDAASGCWRCLVPLGDDLAGSARRAKVEVRFHITVDEEEELALYPVAPAGTGVRHAGQCIVRGPDAGRCESHWLARVAPAAAEAGHLLEVTLEPAARDRREVVTWRVVEASPTGGTRCDHMGAGP